MAENAGRVGLGLEENWDQGQDQETSKEYESQGAMEQVTER